MYLMQCDENKVNTVHSSLIRYQMTRLHLFGWVIVSLKLIMLTNSDKIKIKEIDVEITIYLHKNYHYSHVKDLDD